MHGIDRPLQLVFIRHAESLRNKLRKDAAFFADNDARNIVRGTPDYEVPLTKRGLEQARITGEYLVKHFGLPDYIYHSGYKRTMQTATEILRAFSPNDGAEKRLRMNPFIRERDAGYAYDMTEGEAKSAFPWLDEHWKTFGGFFARPPGGESISDVVQRVYTFVNMLFRDRAGQRVWVVSHGITLRALRFVLERWDYQKALHWPNGESPENCSITVYDYRETRKRLELTEFNTVVWKRRETRRVL